MAVRSKVDSIAESIEDSFSETSFISGETRNVVAGLFAIAESIQNLANAVEKGLTSGKMGEALDGLAGLPSAIGEVADTIREINEPSPVARQNGRDPHDE